MGEALPSRRTPTREHPVEGVAPAEVYDFILRCLREMNMARFLRDIEQDVRHATMQTMGEAPLTTFRDIRNGAEKMYEVLMKKGNMPSSAVERVRRHTFPFLKLKLAPRADIDAEIASLKKVQTDAGEVLPLLTRVRSACPTLLACFTSGNHTRWNPLCDYLEKQEPRLAHLVRALREERGAVRRRITGGWDRSRRRRRKRSGRLQELREGKRRGTLTTAEQCELDALEEGIL